MFKILVKQYNEKLNRLVQLSGIILRIDNTFEMSSKD